MKRHILFILRSLSISLSIYMFVCLYFFHSLVYSFSQGLFLSVCLSLSFSVSLRLSLSLSVSFCLSLSLSFSPCLSLYVRRDKYVTFILIHINIFPLCFFLSISFSFSFFQAVTFCLLGNTPYL